MNHLTSYETYYCEKCGKRESSDVGTPFNQVEMLNGDIKDLCDSCEVEELQRQAAESERELKEIDEVS